MDSLPAEIVEHMLYVLDLRDLTTCRLVNRRMYWIIERMKIRELITSDHYSPRLKCRKWFLTRQPVNCSNLIESSNTRLIKLIRNRTLFYKLNRLYLFGKSLSIQSADESLNHLIHLERLEIVESKLIIDAQFTTLSLPSLKHLNMERSSFIVEHNHEVILDLPKLTKLSMQEMNMNNFIFKHPSSIRIFQLINASYQAFECLVRQFVNLEYFYLKIFASKEFIRKLVRLKELHFNGSCGTFNDFKQEQAKYSRDDLKIFYYDLNLDELPDFSFEYYSNELNDNTVNFFRLHLSRLANIVPFVQKLNYNKVEDTFSREIASDFLSRFIHLQSLEVKGRVNDVDLFKHLLKDCLHLNELEVSASRLDQAFAELPKLCRTILKLEIENEPNDLEFAFLNRFDTLVTFKTNHNVPVEIVHESFKKFKELILFSFVFNGHTITISHYDKDQYLLIGLQSLMRFGRLENLISSLRLSYS